MTPMHLIYTKKSASTDFSSSKSGWIEMICLSVHGDMRLSLLFLLFFTFHLDLTFVWSKDDVEYF